MRLITQCRWSASCLAMLLCFGSWSTQAFLYQDFFLRQTAGSQAAPRSLTAPLGDSRVEPLAARATLVSASSNPNSKPQLESSLSQLPCMTLASSSSPSQSSQSEQAAAPSTVSTVATPCTSLRLPATSGQSPTLQRPPSLGRQLRQDQSTSPAQQQQQAAPPGAVVISQGSQSVTLQSNQQQPIVVVFPQPGSSPSPATSPGSPSPDSPSPSGDIASPPPDSPSPSPGSPSPDSPSPSADSPSPNSPSPDSPSPSPESPSPSADSPSPGSPSPDSPSPSLDSPSPSGDSLSPGSPSPDGPSPSPDSPSPSGDSPSPGSPSPDSPSPSPNSGSPPPDSPSPPPDSPSSSPDSSLPDSPSPSPDSPSPSPDSPPPPSPDSPSPSPATDAASPAAEPSPPPASPAVAQQSLLPVVISQGNQTITVQSRGGSGGSGDQMPVVVVFPQQPGAGPAQGPAGQTAQLSKPAAGATALPLAVDQGVPPAAAGGAVQALPPASTATLAAQNLSSQAQLLADTLFKPTPDAANSRVPPSSPTSANFRQDAPSSVEGFSLGQLARSPGPAGVAAMNAGGRKYSRH